MISIMQRKPLKEQHSTDLSVISNDDKAEELSHNIAVNTKPHWNAEISKL